MQPVNVEDIYGKARYGWDKEKFEKAMRLLRTIIIFENTEAQKFLDKALEDLDRIKSFYLQA
jgi:hypothetical protein